MNTEQRQVLRKRTADTAGAYFIPIPVSGFEGLRFSDAEVTIHVGARSFHLQIDSSDLDAFNGSYAGQTNELDGRVTVSGTSYQVPVRPEEAALDPEYDQQVFDSSYVCLENLAEPVPVP